MVEWRWCYKEEQVLRGGSGKEDGTRCSFASNDSRRSSQLTDFYLPPCFPYRPPTPLERRFFEQPFSLPFVLLSTFLVRRVSCSKLKHSPSSLLSVSPSHPTPPPSPSQKDPSSTTRPTLRRSNRLSSPRRALLLPLPRVLESVEERGPSGWVSELGSLELWLWELVGGFLEVSRRVVYFIHLYPDIFLLVRFGFVVLPFWFALHLSLPLPLPPDPTFFFIYTHTPTTPSTTLLYDIPS